MEPPVAPWPPGTPRAATAGANAGVSSSRMSLRVVPTPPSAGSTPGAGGLRPPAESARDPRKILTSSMSPPFTAVSTPGGAAGPSARLRPDPRHIGSPRSSSRPSRLNDSLSQSNGGVSGIVPGSAPASLSVTWDSVSPDDDPAMSTLSREDKATFMRRYFFTERGYETDRMPTQKHFDVLMQDVPPEYAGDHLYCRYVDFMREGKEQPRAEDLGLIDEATSSPNTMVIAEWLRSAHPRTRLDACPMFFLTKQVLINLMDGEVATANRLREQANHALAELREEHTAAMRAHADALDKAEDRYVDRESALLGEIDQIKAKLADAQTQIGALTGERDSSREECAGLQKEIKRLGSVEQILLTDLARNKEVQEGLKRELYETTIAVAEAQAECAAEKQHGIELSNQILRLKDWKEDAEAKTRALQNDLAASQAQGDKLKKEMDALSAVVANMKEEIYDLNEELAQAHDGADRLQRESERKLKAAANAGSGTSNELRDEIKQAHQREEQLEQELSNHRAEQRSLQRKLDEHAAQVAEELAQKEAEKVAHKEKISQMVADADEMAKLLTNAPALRTMSAGADAPDWRKVEEIYRKAVYERPESGDLKFKLGKAERNVQKLNALEYGDAALREDPSDFVTALVAYKQALALSPTEDPELEFAIQIAEHGLTFSEANTAAEHGETDAALKQYQEVLADLSWVEQVESLLSEPEPEPEPEEKHEDNGGKEVEPELNNENDGGEQGTPGEATGVEGDGISATAGDVTIDSFDVELSIERAPASVVAALCADPARPYAYGRRLAQCRKAATDYPHDPVVSAALRMAVEETERSAMLRNRVKDQLQVVQDEEAKKVREIQEAQAEREAEAAARETEKAAMANTISELEVKIEDVQKALEEARGAAAAQAEEAIRAAEEAAAAQAAAADAAEAEAAAAIGGDAEDMSAEEQLAAVKAMQRSTKEAQKRSKEAIRKTTEEAARLRAEHEVYERNAVAYKLAQQKILDEAERWKEELKAERQRSVAALAATDMAAESARTAERLRFGQSMKGLSRILTMGLANDSDGFSAPDLEEMRQMLLLMVDGGKPMEDAMTAAAEKIALANNAAQAAAAATPAEPVSPSPPAPVETATIGCQTDYGYKRGYANSPPCTPGGTPWESPWSHVEAGGPPDGMRASSGQGRHGRSDTDGCKHVGLKKGGRATGQKKTMKTVAIGASYSKGKNSHGQIGQMPVHASSVWWAKTTAPLAVELKSATPPPGRIPAEWERSRPPKSKSAR